MLCLRMTFRSCRKATVKHYPSCICFWGIAKVVIRRSEGSFLSRTGRRAVFRLHEFLASMDTQASNHPSRSVSVGQFSVRICLWRAPLAKIQRYSPESRKMTYAMGAPVRSTPLLHSRDAQSLCETVHKHVRSLEFHFTSQQDFEGTARLFLLQDLRLGLFGVSAPGALTVSEVGDFRQSFVSSGQIKTRLDERDAGYQPGDSLITMPGQTRTYDFGENFSQTLVTIDPLALNRKLSALFGKKPNRKLEFVLNSEFSRAHNHHLRGLVDLYVRYLSSTNPLPPFLHQQMEETIVVAFLSANEHNYSRHLQDDAASAAPRTVRLAEEYIEANWDRSISIEELAEVTNTSARSLFRSFQ